MEVVPASVGPVSRSWDEQHLDLRSAADQIRDAGTSGFTAAVQGSAVRFATTWERHADRLAVSCEGQADSLRVTIQDYLDTDGNASADYLQLVGFLREVR